MELDTLTNQVYVVAVNEARLQGHEYVTPEHFLYGALMFDLGKEIIQESGGRVEAMLDDLRAFLETRIPRQQAENPSESYAFVQLFELAAAQAGTTGKNRVTLAELLFAILQLPESFAQYIMLKNGLNRLAMLRYITHEIVRDADAAVSGARTTETDFLQQYTVDLCEKARSGLLDPLIGREDILERTTQVLCRRLKNNPVHVGDPGVGKTAVVEGLAQRIVAGGVPDALLGSHVLMLDMGSLLAGTKYRGEFEERLVKLLEIIARMPKPILYIDEIHSVVGAGAVAGGGMDATSIIKPYLSKGEIRFIGSTTFDEFKKHFEKDRALARRFQPISIQEPTLQECVEILQGIKSRYEAYHNVAYTDEIVMQICELSVKYMNDRFLPDKAIDVMDEAGAYARMHRGQNPTVAVTRKDVEYTVATMAKIPEGNITGDEMEALRTLESRLNNEIFGQEAAVEAIAGAIKTSRSGLSELEKPVASLLFVGPTGVGKTEVARQLALMMGIKLLRFDMTEYQEKHAVARLIGAPPGYVGYEEGGLLTEAVRRTPHSVLLLDEIEKAHNDILNVLLQVMDYGTLTDNSGKKTDFRNAILIMTSNAGARDLGKKIIGFEGTRNTGAVERAVDRLFSPEFRNRLDAIVRFNPVNESMARAIAVKAINSLARKLAKKQVQLTVSERAIEHIAREGLSEVYGAREIIRLVENDVKKQLVNEVLFGDLEDGGDATLDEVDGRLVVEVY